MKEKEINKQSRLKSTLVFLFCLLISFFLWIMVKESKYFVKDISCVIRYTDLPEDKFLVGKVDSVLHIKIKSQGIDILSSGLFRHPIPFNLNQLTLKQTGDHFEAYFNAADIVNKYITEADAKVEVLSVEPQTLVFKMRNVVSKKVPIIPSLSLGFINQYHQYAPIICIPDSVTIVGYPSTLYHIHSVPTVSHTLVNLAQNTQVSLPLISSKNPQAYTIPSLEVKVTVPVEKFTEQTIELPINRRSLSGKTIKLFPDKVLVTYLVALKDFSKIKPSQFSVDCDYKLMGNNIKKLPIILSKQPSMVKITKVKPADVEYLIIK